MLMHPVRDSNSELCKKRAFLLRSYLSSQNSLGRPWKGARGEHTRVNYKFPKAVAGWNHKFQMRGRLHSTGDSSNRGALMNANWRFSRSASRLLVFVDDPYQKYHHGYKFLWKCNRTKSFHWLGIGGIYLSVPLCICCILLNLFPSCRSTRTRFIYVHCFCLNFINGY